MSDRDFWNARQYDRKEANRTTESMMRSPIVLPMEELEAIGEETVQNLNKAQKNILAPVAYHWPNGILYYTIDAAFSSSERAVIASGFTHMEENSCIRWGIGKEILSSVGCRLKNIFIFL